MLDRGAPGDTIRWIDVDPFWVFHFLNGHDDGDAVVVEGCRAERLNVGFGEDQPDDVPTALHRWRVDLATGTVADEALDDRPGRLPAGGRRRGRAAGPVRLPGRGPPTWDEQVDFGGVTKVDLRSGTSTTLSWGPGESGGEAVFAADPGRAGGADAEDAGWLLAYVCDKATRATDLVVADAQGMEEVARVHLPRRVPFGFHGSWLPDT